MKESFVRKYATEKWYKEIMLPDFNSRYNWPCCWCCQLITILCLSVCHFGSLPSSLVLSFVIYGNHICVVHILSIACAGSTRNLLITKAIISVVACGIYLSYHVPYQACSGTEIFTSQRRVVVHCFSPNLALPWLPGWPTCHQKYEMWQSLVHELCFWSGKFCKVAR